MVKQQKYYFDLDGVRAKSTYDNSRAKNLQTNLQKNSVVNGRDVSGGLGDNNGYKNPGDVSDFWDIPTQPSSEKHYATFNTDLIDKPIVAGCPEYVCKKCGKPREKIIKVNSVKSKRENFGEQPRGAGQQSSSGWQNPIYKFEGLTDCGCNAGFEGGVILDPFCGTGTTLIRGLQLGRQVIGIDGKEEYCEIANKRIKQELSQMKLF